MTINSSGNKGKGDNSNNSDNGMTHDQEALFHQVRLFSGLNHQELHSLEKGKEVWFNRGDKILDEGQYDTFYVVLEGKVEIILRDGAKESILSTYNSGDHFGELPIILGWSEHKCAAFAAEKTRLLEWDTESFWRMVYSSPSLIKQILQSMGQLLKTLETVLQHNQKLIALGGLAAGLAHELNNPAAAAKRSVTQLSDSILEWRSLIQRLNGEEGITSSQWSYVCKLRDNTKNFDPGLASRRILDGVSMTNDTITGAGAGATKTDDPIMQSEIEEGIINWLETHGISDGWKLASDLLDAGITINELNEISKIINSRSRSLKGTDMTDGDDGDDGDNNRNAKNLEDILSWLTTSIKVDHLLYEIKSSTVRISDLVSAVKSYSYMDRTPLQEVDIHEGLESTLTILQYKLRKAGINVIREFDPNLQKINAYGNELNQVWTNLIDNAIDGIGKDGTISIRTKNEGNDHVLVEIADNGKQGIPEDVKSHIFEPFFTTKEQGKGTGIGLSISHRIVTETHRGDIRVYSVPGETRFQVRLPIIYKEGLEKRYWSWVKPMDYQAKS